jgi:hypothetical protein
VDGQFSLYLIGISLAYKEALRESVAGTGHRLGVPARFKHLAAEAGKEVAEALRDNVVMIVGEAVKRAIWG